MATPTTPPSPPPPPPPVPIPDFIPDLKLSEKAADHVANIIIAYRPIMAAEKQRFLSLFSNIHALDRRCSEEDHLPLVPFVYGMRLAEKQGYIDNFITRDSITKMVLFQATEVPSTTPEMMTSALRLHCRKIFADILGLYYRKAVPYLIAPELSHTISTRGFKNDICILITFEFTVPRGIGWKDLVHLPRGCDYNYDQ
jgi:hypothetical protein